MGRKEQETAKQSDTGVQVRHLSTREAEAGASQVLCQPERDTLRPRLKRVYVFVYIQEVTTSLLSTPQRPRLPLDGAGEPSLLAHRFLTK